MERTATVLVPAVQFIVPFWTVYRDDDAVTRFLWHFTNDSYTFPLLELTLEPRGDFTICKIMLYRLFRRFDL